MTERLRVHDYLSHIREAIARIQTYIEDIDEVKFLHMPMVQDAVLRNIEVIGEAANCIDKRYPAFTNSHPEIDWLVIYAMRNRVCHAYHRVDLDIVWRTVQQDLPSLQTHIMQLLSEFQREISQ